MNYSVLALVCPSTTSSAPSLDLKNKTYECNGVTVPTVVSWSCLFSPVCCKEQVGGIKVVFQAEVVIDTWMIT